jgi:hypothetical protein
MLHRRALSLASVAPAPVASVNPWLADAPHESEGTAHEGEPWAS